jgi:mannose-1-phosphate guanylyltransferase / mannose-6-phosphate isomerase
VALVGLIFLNLKSMKITPVILSGGSGTRLWPVSRSLDPKQFLDFFGENSLFQKTALRVKNLDDFFEPIIICNNEHRFRVAQELQKINASAKSIILEPIGRNTAPAIAIAALDVLAKNATQDLILVMPSDHIISDEAAFIGRIKNAAKAALEGYLVTFGVVPNKPETGYGYIKKSAALQYFSEIFAVEKFVEKPDLATAQNFLKSGEYLWNSGIFLFKASSYLEALKKLQSETFINCEKAYKNSVQDLDFIRLDEENFAKCANISIDYAVMEKATKIAVAPLLAGWLDVGSWQAIAEISSKDQNQNSLIGDVATIRTKGCYINSRNRLTATIGVENLIIISLKDVVLVANKDDSQSVKEMFELLKKQNRNECNSHTKVLRPWGSFETIDLGNRFKVKKIIVKPSASLSLQMHNKRAEHWVIVKGKAHVTCGEKEFIMNEDESTYIPIGQKHRLENKGNDPLEIIEVQTGQYLEEDDIVRFSDIYGR